MLKLSRNRNKFAVFPKNLIYGADIVLRGIISYFYQNKL